MKYVTEIEVSNYTGISVSKLQKDRCRGLGIPYAKIGRAIRYNLETVKEFMESKIIHTYQEAS